MHRIAVFASGEGTNFEAIAGACEQGVLDARAVLLVCDRPGAHAVDRAAAHGVETFVFSPGGMARGSMLRKRITKTKS